jgi:hypothetical protein
MTEQNYLILFFLFFSNIVSLILGYILGQLKSLSGVYTTTGQPNKTLSSVISPDTKRLVEIDSSKFVTNITTDGMEKKYSVLGDIKDSDENISLSVDKLKNFKK